MKLEVGEFYLSAGGEIVKIEREHSGDYTFQDTNFRAYTENGKFRQYEESKEDLIAHIPKELHWSIVSQVYSYYSNINARNKIIRRHKNFFNKKKIIMPD